MAGFCDDCPDHEACSTGYPCDVVKRFDSYSQAEHLDGIDRARERVSARRAARLARARHAVARLARAATQTFIPAE